MTIRDLISRHAHFEGGPDLDAVTEAWEETGFSAAEVAEWLAARCFDPGIAEDMADAGITPDLAAVETAIGGDYVDTVAFKVCQGDLEVEESRDILGVT